MTRLAGRSPAGGSRAGTGRAGTLRVALAAAAVALIGAVTPAASAQTVDAVSVARGLLAAENAHNVGAAVDFFAPGAIVVLPTGVLTSRADITQWQSELAAGNFHNETTTPVAVTPEVVTFTGTVALDLFRGLGLSTLDATWQLTIQLGKVTTFTFDFTPAATARLAAAAGAAAGAGAGGPASAGSGSAGGSSSAAAPAPAATAAPATRSLALTGAPAAVPATAGALSIGAGLLLLTVARRRTSPPT